MRYYFRVRTLFSGFSHYFYVTNEVKFPASNPDMHCSAQNGAL